MKFHTAAALAIAAISAPPEAVAEYIPHPSTGSDGREPTYNDFVEVQEEIEFRINDSTCPHRGHVPSLSDHWNGEDEDGDCKWIKRERNPDGLGSRLVRHAFHDAAGGLDGFVLTSDKKENGALDASEYFLSEVVWKKYTLNDGYALKNVISLADLTAWAATAAVIYASKKQTGTDRLDDGDMIPPIPIRWGRVDYVQGDDWAYVPDKTMPKEKFPDNGPASTGDEIIAYFAEAPPLGFGLTERESVTLMGAHTLGGARLDASGYTGMWTRSKGEFNVDYHIRMQKRNAIECQDEAGGNEELCTEFWDEGTETCSAEGRCEGWEQVQLPNQNYPDIGTKFQWRHSCSPGARYRANSECTEMMMNVDMGMLIDIENHICRNDGDEKVWRKKRSTGSYVWDDCKKGQVFSFPEGSHCDFNNTDQRILASCFNRHPAQSSQYIIDDSEDMATFISNFGPVFDKVLSRTNPNENPLVLPELLSSAPTTSPTPAPVTFSPTDHSLTQNGGECSGPNSGSECESGSCEYRRKYDTHLCCANVGESCSNNRQCCNPTMCLGEGICGE